MKNKLSNLKNLPIYDTLILLASWLAWNESKQMKKFCEIFRNFAEIESKSFSRSMISLGVKNYQIDGLF